MRQFPASAGFRMQLLHTKEEVLKPQVSSGTLWVLSAATGRKLPAGDNKKEKYHGPLKAAFTNIARHCEASAHTACGDPSPTVEHQASSTTQRSGSVSRNTPIPCFGGIQDATLAHKGGGLETLGFKWHSLGTFCCYWQKVIRRRQQKSEGS